VLDIFATVTGTGHHAHKKTASTKNNPKINHEKIPHYHRFRGGNAHGGSGGR